MAKQEYSKDDAPNIKGAKIAIMQSSWHQNYTDVMKEKCIEVLEEAEADVSIQHVVPGCFELPLATKIILQRERCLDAVIVFGALIKGDTFHFEMVMNECVRGLGQIMLEFNVPIINEILPVTNEQQLRDRCSDDSFNKGFEAGIAAAQMISWKRKIT